MPIGAYSCRSAKPIIITILGQKRSNTKNMISPHKERTNLGPIVIKKDQYWSFLLFFLRFPIFLLEIVNIVSQLSYEVMLKISRINIEKCRSQEIIVERTNLGPILIGPFFLNLCRSYDHRFHLSGKYCHVCN